MELTARDISSFPSSRLVLPADATMGSTIARIGFRVLSDLIDGRRVGHDDDDFDW
jgi:hypothetical protein